MVERGTQPTPADESLARHEAGQFLSQTGAAEHLTSILAVNSALSQKTFIFGMGSASPPTVVLREQGGFDPPIKPIQIQVGEHWAHDRALGQATERSVEAPVLQSKYPSWSSAPINRRKRPSWMRSASAVWQPRPCRNPCE